ncbi:aminotransferase class V-fold PLP-dependent enzyme [Janthinobacterium sp. PLB04]|uniref:Aminotransferase class V-fold PLP-dependent enzyme n=1 Tax=Janthinobacterium lividum TaxID=29581 RepID=A0AAJ4MY31_9BURK|nr:MULTISPECIES: aminotransferase class V-fold PLP-dependent enzyme [Janthinobacterium]KAB0324751.1 aminotransferase class V-fold PLP-dependent enzyme [Janthinobacterium lividum]QSX98861.1 aminotransferase class V-fold PLP-dependent enzyme [Janthinobacterium lividum]UGQ38836.1 aminotransferase class V-fold PLP-dependent enzyme [Janthinobacterium sp. PLB04]
MPDHPVPPLLADGAARDEAWWRQVAALYPAPPDAIVNLEHGYFGAMAAPVQAAFEQAVRYTNEQLSPFVRGEFTRTHVDILRQRVAALIHAEPRDILLTRSGTESMQVLITQYHGLAPGDTVLWSNLDYPAMRTAMRWLAQRRGVTSTQIKLSLPIGDDEIIASYAQAMRQAVKPKLLLLSQVTPANGQQLPVQAIMALAREHGIDVLLDSAHALGQVDVDVQAMGVDFAGFNLHKWLGAPAGLGIVYIRASQLHKIEPHFGDDDYPPDDIRGRLHMGMPPIGAILAAPAALDFHARLGGTPAKNERLAWLRHYWVSRVAQLPGVRILSPLDARRGTALVAFAVDGMRARELQQVLLHRFGVFTVERNIGDTDVVRATVAITTTIGELDRLVAALTALSRETDT